MLAMSACCRCTAPGAAIMSFDYPAAEVWLEDLRAHPQPGQGYVMCTKCADKLTPPLGWRLADRRSVARLFAPLEVA